MRTVIVPDVHENIAELEVLLVHAGPADETIFLGDWFDSFKHTAESATQTLDWLLVNKNNPRYCFIWGNHDLPYAYQNIASLECSGHRWSTRLLLAQRPDIWTRFVFSRIASGHLCSHAGFYKNSISCLGDAESWGLDAQRALDEGHDSPLVSAGRARGGFLPLGGCTWLDWDREFEPSEFPQIVGHTRGKDVRRKGTSICIDTDLRHYAVIEDGVLSTAEVPSK